MKSWPLPEDGPENPAVRAAQKAQAFPLPDYAHVPGSNERPDEAFFEPVKEVVPEKTTDETAFENLAWHYGLRLINEAFYWEAHEVLEPVWMNAAPNSRERQLVQGVIHLANAALKREMARKRAVLRLVDLADECFERAFMGANSKNLMGLSLDGLHEAGAMITRNADRVAIEISFSEL